VARGGAAAASFRVLEATAARGRAAAVVFLGGGSGGAAVETRSDTMWNFGRKRVPIRVSCCMLYKRRKSPNDGSTYVYVYGWSTTPYRVVHIILFNMFNTKKH
jgi:hypothetical protein